MHLTIYIQSKPCGKPDMVRYMVRYMIRYMIRWGLLIYSNHV